MTDLSSDKIRRDPLIGTVLGDRYEIISRLGKGGMAIVYLAKQKLVDREVAVKVLRGEVARDETAVKRLIREAKAAMKLRHPNIIDIFDVGQTSEGIVYLGMELLRGKPLSDILESDHKVTVDRAVHIGAQIADALAEAHKNNVVHRDIKPENVFLVEHNGDHDFVKVLDFSIAKLPDNMVTHVLTRAGTVFGTPHYMAPEQIQGKAVGGPTDLYALGAMVYELVCGSPPFDGNSPIEILMQHLQKAPPPLEASGVALPPGLAGLVAKMLAKDPKNRPETAAEVVGQFKAMEASLRGGVQTAPAAAAQPVAAPPPIAVAPPAPPAPPPQTAADPHRSRVPHPAHAAPVSANPVTARPAGVPGNMRPGVRAPTKGPAGTSQGTAPHAPAAPSPAAPQPQTQPQSQPQAMFAPPPSQQLSPVATLKGIGLPPTGPAPVPHVSMGPRDKSDIRPLPQREKSDIRPLPQRDKGDMRPLQGGSHPGVLTPATHRPAVTGVEAMDPDEPKTRVETEAIRDTAAFRAPPTDARLESGSRPAWLVPAIVAAALAIGAALASLFYFGADPAAPDPAEQQPSNPR